MRYVAGERAGPDGPPWVIVLEGGPADGSTLKYDFVGPPDTVQIRDSYRPIDELNGYLDEYIRTDIRDDAGRTVYVHRRRRYTAEGGVWRPA